MRCFQFPAAIGSPNGKLMGSCKCRVRCVAASLASRAACKGVVAKKKRHWLKINPDYYPAVTNSQSLGEEKGSEWAQGISPSHTATLPASPATAPGPPILQVHPLRSIVLSGFLFVCFLPINFSGLLWALINFCFKVSACKQQKQVVTVHCPPMAHLTLSWITVK